MALARCTSLGAIHPCGPSATQRVACCMQSVEAWRYERASRVCDRGDRARENPVPARRGATGARAVLPRPGEPTSRHGQVLAKHCRQAADALARVLHLRESGRAAGTRLVPASRLTCRRERGLVRGVLPWVSRVYLRRGARSACRLGVFAALLVGVGGALHWDASAAPANPGDRAKALVLEVEADASARELTGPPTQKSKAASSRAEGSAPAAAALLDATALEWAEVARDLLRASAAERTSDRLEQDAAALEAEIARTRAAVEQTMARVGRARQDLEQLEPASAGAAAGGPQR